MEYRSLRFGYLVFAGICIVFFFNTIFAYPAIRYKDKIFTEVTKKADIKYGSNTNVFFINQDLRLDVYMPENDTVVDRPCIVFIHGGSFMYGTKEEEIIVALCREFALRGYVTASIEYRLGATILKEAFGEAILRAVQDAKAAVRFLRANRLTFGVSDSLFVVGGTSAGGVTAVHYAYFDSDEIPPYLDTAALGGIEGESGTPQVISKIRCIVNCWGAIADSAWLTGESTPVISFHGTEDAVVPYEAGYAFNLPNLPLYGSAVIHRVCLRQGIASELKPYTGMGHGHSATSSQMDTTVKLTADFLYRHLFGASAVNEKAMPSPVAVNHPGAYTVFAALCVGKALLSHERDVGSIVYGLDGRVLHREITGGSGAMRRGTAAGMYVIGKERRRSAGRSE